MVAVIRTKAEKRALQAQELDAFRAINLEHVRATVSEALEHFGRGSLFDEYTKHNISHVDAMLNIYDWLIPDSTQRAMTPADWLLITLATYLHDFGLLVTRSEFENRGSTDFASYRERISEGQDPKYRDYRAQVAEMDSTEAERFLYQEFVRDNHARRVRSWLQDAPQAALGFDPDLASALRSMLQGLDDSFIEDVGIVAESHHMNDLGDLAKYPVNRPYGASSSEEANVQYAALVLRTADLLHITRDRVPAVSALIVNPRNPKSQVEWAKQAAVRSVRPKLSVPDESGDVKSPDTIEVHATFKEPEGYFGLTSYLSFVAEQVLQTHRWAADAMNRGAAAYLFPWRKVDTDEIKARGFIANQFQFTIDQGKILDLLTGHTLYNDTDVVVRELLQNALDATRLLEYTAVEPDYHARIKVHWDPDVRMLRVSDNGTGMTQEVIERNFLRVGSSRYQSAEFVKRYPGYNPISRFGIGVLSAFMVADHVTVITNSTEDDHARHLDLRDVHGMYLVRLLEKTDATIPDDLREHGTEVTLHLRPSATMRDVAEVLEDWIVIPGCEVLLRVKDGPEVKVGSETVEAALESSLLSAGNLKRREDGGLQTVFGAPAEVRVVETPELSLAYAVQWNKWLQEWSFVSPRVPFSRRESSARPMLGTCIGGVRVTTAAPGFVSGGIAALANAHGKGAPRTNVARSAIERTEEYEAFLSAVYAGYMGHVETEMQQFEDEREASLSMAAREASYLVRPLIGDDAALVSLGRFTDAARAIGAIVVETDGLRGRRSIKELEAISQLETFESITVARLEQVLSSVRGAHGASLTTLLKAVGGESGVLSAQAPLVCNVGGGGFFAQTFLEAWEPSKIASDALARELRVEWTRVDPGRPGWLVRPKPSRVPSELRALVEDDRLREAPQMFARAGCVEAEGFVEKLVAAHGVLLVLPEHPVNHVRLLGEFAMDSPERLWIMDWMLRLMMSVRASVARRQVEAAKFGAVDYLELVVSRLRGSGAMRYVDEDSLGRALAGFETEVLNVMRWDRSGESHD